MMEEKVLPYVTFVIPFYNEKECLNHCVESIRRLDYPRDKLEIILVDDASTDGSDSIAKELATDSIVKLFRNRSRRGVGVCLNIGIGLALGEIIAHFAADMLVEPLYLKKLVRHFDSSTVAAVIPQVKALGDEKSSRLFRLDAPVTAPGILLARKNLLQSVRLYDSSFFRKLPRVLGGWKIYFREDTDLVLSLIDHGYTVVGEPSALAYHPIDRVRISDIPRLGLRYCVDPLLLKKHPKSARGPLKLAFWRVSYWALAWLAASLAATGILFLGLKGNLNSLALSATIAMILYGIVYYNLYRRGGFSRIGSPIFLYLFLTMVVIGRLYGSAREKYFVV